MKRFKDFIQENDDVVYERVYKRTCLMADVPKYLGLDGVDNLESSEGFVNNHNTFENFSHIHIKEDDLYNAEGGYGREDHPHITILYGGFAENADKDLVSIRRMVRQIRPFKVALGKIGKFQRDDYDVIKIDVIPNSDINALHYLIKNNIDNDYEFPQFSPHITIAYVKPGSCDNLIGNDTFEGIEIHIDHLDFSMGDGTLKSVYIPYSKVDVNNIVETTVVSLTPKKLEEDGSPAPAGPSSTAPTSIENGQYPTRGVVVRRGGKKFKDRYRGTAFLYPDRLQDPSSEYGTGDSSSNS